MVAHHEVSRRTVELSAEDAELIQWTRDGYPPALEPLLKRLRDSQICTLNVNQGWWPLVLRADAEIAIFAPDYRIVRLGEDLGVLVFEVHADDLTEAVENVLEGARSASVRTCEICADRGYAYRQGEWLITLCVDHARARGARPARTDADFTNVEPRVSDRELAFALSAGVPASAFTGRARRENEAYLDLSAEADETEMASWMTSAEVARLLGSTPAEVNELRKRRALHAGRRRSGRWAFPRWQFDRQNRPLAGLRDVLAALSDEPPIHVNNMMTSPSEELDGLAPAQWLGQRRPIEAVQTVIEDWTERDA